MMVAGFSLDEFLTGEPNLGIDVLDRLAHELRFVLHAKEV